MTIASLGVSVDSSGVARGIADLDKLVPASARAEKAAEDLGNAATAAARKTGAAAEEIARRLGKAANDAENLAARINKSMRIDAFGGPDRARDIAEYGQSLDALRAKFNPLHAELVRYRGVQAEIRDAHRVGAISVDEMTAALNRERTAALANVAAIKGRNVALNEAGAFQTANIAAQFQDVAVTAAMGMSPGMIALQQGTQIAAVLGPMGATGAVEGLKSALLSVISPVSLVTIGLTGVAAAAISYFFQAGEGAKTLQDRLDTQRSALDALASGWERVENAVRGAGQESHAVLSFQSMRAIDDLRRGLDDEFTRGNLTSRFASAGMFGGSQIFSEYREVGLDGPIRRLLDEVETGTVDIVRFNSEIAAMGNVPGASSELKKRIAEILEFTRAIGDAQRAVQNFDRNIGPGGLVRGGSEFNRRDMETYEQWRREEQSRLRRATSGSQIDLDAIGARSPAQLAEITRRRAANVFDEGESGNERRQRIDAAANQARIEAEFQLSEAQAERLRSLRETVDAQRMEIGLIGQTAGAAAALRMEYDLSARLREEAARNGVAVDEAELALVRQKSAEYGRLVAQQEALTRLQSQRDQIELARAEFATLDLVGPARERAMDAAQAEIDIRKMGIALYGQEANAIRANISLLADLREAKMRANLASDLRFELDQMGRSDREGSIAARLRGTGIGMNSPEADLMRRMQSVEQMRDSATGFFSAIKEGVMEGGDIGRNIMRRIADAMLDEADKLLDNVIQTLVRSLIPAPAAPAGLGAGAGGAAAFIPTGGAFAKMIFGAAGGGANDNYAPGAVTRAPLAAIGNAAAYRDAIASIESAGSGGYAAIGPTHATMGRALGRYQIMEANIGPWSQQALGHSITPAQFMASPSHQDKIFDHVFGGYVGKYGEKGAAQAWFGGPGSVGKLGRSDVLGTTVGSYGEKFTSALERMQGQATSATEALAGVAENAAGATQGLGQFGSMLSQFPAAPAAPGGGIGGFFRSLFGGGATFGSMSAISPFAASHIAGGGVGLFAEGGISDRPAIFGEAGPEAAVPLSRGRKIPVELRGANANRQATHVTVGVSFDSDEGFRAYVKNVAQSEGQAAASSTVRQYDSQLPDRIAAYDRNPRRRS